MNKEYLKIPPSHTEKDFLRKVLVELANEDAPLDVFNSDFSDVKTEEYHILSTNANFSANWQGDIGNYCTVPYEDYETYYEEVPYLGIEEKYDRDIGWYKTQVEKKRKEERQRRVTRYLQKTEWYYSNGIYSGEVGSFECIDPKDSFTRERYEKEVDSKYFVSFTDEELAKSKDMTITKAMMDRVEELHKKDGEIKMLASLPGSTYKNITYNFNCNPTSITLLRIPEYYLTINYNGNTYQKRAFAFGNMTLTGDKINNPSNTKDEINKKMNDAETYVKEKTDATNKAIATKENEINKIIQESKTENKEIAQERIQNIDSKIWKKTRIFSFISILLLLTSIISSIFIRLLTPVIIIFACAIVGLVISDILVYKMRNKITQDTENQNSNDKIDLEVYCDNLKNECNEYTTKLNQACQTECKAYMDNITLECENYENLRRSDMLATLNEKLASLDMSPATIKEYYSKTITQNEKICKNYK